MSETFESPVVLTIDTKKNRLRIHKASLHKIGDPMFIQLLVNPVDMLVAIRGMDQEYSCDQTHRVRLVVHDSYEIYSKHFVESLCSLKGIQTPGKIYRLDGSVYKNARILLFPLNTLRPIDAAGG